jgi:Cytochrome C oxidase, cbb3-type, subunit III
MPGSDWAAMRRLVILVWAGSLIAQQGTRNLRTTPGDIAAGAQTFRSHCAPCHGLKGEGGRGPNLASGRFYHGASDADLLTNISDGIRCFTAGPPPTAKLSGEGPLLETAQNVLRAIFNFVRHSSAITTKKRSRAQSSLANWPPVRGASLGSPYPASSRRAGVGRLPQDKANRVYA